MKRLPLLLPAIVVSLVLPVAAHAANVKLDGSPLNTHLGDTGRLQIRFDGQTSGEFFSSTSDEANAGFQLGVDIGTDSATHMSFRGFTPAAQMPVSGSGTDADPLRQVTVFTTPIPSQPGQSLTITQTAEYVNGRNSVKLRWEVTSSSSAPTTVRPTLYADLTVGGNDDGTGFFEQGPPRAVGGIDAVTSATGGIVELTPWRSFEEGSLGTVSGHSSDISPDNSGGFTNTISSQNVDNAVGVQWNDQGVAAGSPYVIEAAWRFNRLLDIDPLEDSHAVGSVHATTVRLRRSDGSVGAGVPVNFNVTGANSATGTATTSPEGTAVFEHRGAGAGTDTITAHADLNANGSIDPGEPSRTATVEWIAPQPFTTAVFEVVRGTVLVQLPPGAQASDYGLNARASQGGFMPLEGAKGLPLGTIVNANRGELRLASAANSAGAVQRANFYSGTFQVLQRRAARPVTDLVLKGGSFRGCGRSARSAVDPEADASQRRGRRVRRLWGNGRGRFRTRGRYSSATVRGTTWLVEDRCNGTLTRVGRRPRSSRVVVRDLARRRNITLRAGRSYFAFRRGAGKR